jgi:hypothetical protein
MGNKDHSRYSQTQYYFNRMFQPKMSSSCLTRTTEYVQISFDHLRFQLVEIWYIYVGLWVKGKKVNQSRYRPGVAQKVLGS